METQIRVRGLNELVRGLRAVYPELPKIVRETNRAFAQRVVPSVQRAYEARYPRKSGHGVGSIRATAAASRATIAIGGTRAPYLPGQEFGANRHTSRDSLGRRLTRFPVYRPAASGRGGEGYFLYPTVREQVPGLVDDYIDAVDAALGRAFAAGPGGAG